MKDGKLKVNPYLYSHKRANELIARLITPINTYADISGTRKEEDIMEHIIQLIDDEFRKNALEYYRYMGYEIQVQSILRSLGNIRAYLTNSMKVEKKMIVAVGGKFDSGKSTFLNYVLGRKEYLPTDIRACSITPTYIYHDSGRQQVLGETWDGRLVRLDENILQTISHQFETKFGFNLSNLLGRVHVSLDCPQLGKLVFIDTPGTDNIKSLTSVQSDTDIALEAFEQADFLLWLKDATEGELTESQREIFDAARKPKILLFSHAKFPTEQQREDVFRKAIDEYSHDPFLVAIVMYDGMEEKIYRGINLQNRKEIRSLPEVLALMNKNAGDNPLSVELESIRQHRENIIQSLNRTIHEYQKRIRLLNAHAFEQELPKTYARQKKKFLDDIVRILKKHKNYFSTKLQQVVDEVETLQMQKKNNLVDSGSECDFPVPSPVDIMDAISRKDINRFCECLQVPLDPYVEWDNHYSLLSYIAAYGSPEMLQICREEGVDLKKRDKNGDTILQTAVIHTNKEVIRWLANNIPRLFDSMEKEWDEVYLKHIDPDSRQFIHDVQTILDSSL